MGLSFPSFKMGLSSDPRVLGDHCLAVDQLTIVGCSSGSNRSGSVRSRQARCGRVPGRVAPTLVVSSLPGAAPRRHKLSRGNSGRCGRALGRGGAAAYKKGCAPALSHWFVLLKPWRLPACLRRCCSCSSEASPRSLASRYVFEGCLREGGGWVRGCLLCSPKSRDREGVGCIMSCAPPSPSGRRDRENFMRKLCSGVAGRLPETPPRAVHP